MMRLSTNIKTKVLTALLTIAALAAGQTAWADATFQVPVGIIGMTNGNQSTYVITSPNMQDQYTVNGTEKFFENVTVNIGSNTVPITMSLYGTIEFANSSSATDVTVAEPEFKLTFTSTTNYFTNASVTTKAGAAVSGCSVSGKNSQTLTVTIPENTTFGSVVLTLATHTPLNHCTIGGIADSYIADGVNKPVPTVTLEGQTLRQDVDYTLSYSYGNTSGTVTVTGTGDYTGSKSQHYDIREPNLSDLHQFGDGAYEIATQQDLDYLARIVNGKGNTRNNCNGVTFRQTADIAYSYTNAWDYVYSADNNFTPIGGFARSFEGTYDGQGHTISGIRVYKLGSGNEDSSLGLFGYISGNGTVKNVVLSDAHFWGYQNIGGIAGFIDFGSVTDCYLYHVSVRSAYSNDSRSILVGNKGGIVTRTHYHDCAEFRLAGISSDNDYKSSVFALNPDASVVLPPRTGGTAVSSSLTTYADGITLSGTEYYAAGTALALTYNGTVPTGQWPRFTATSGSNEDKTAEVIDGATLTMPAYDIAVHCDQLLPVVTYLDGDGIEQQCSGYTPITSSDNNVYLGATGTTGWYVVGSDATISGKLNIKGNVNLILCDGATLSVSYSGTVIDISGNFTIYGQQQGTGALNAINTSVSPAIFTYRDITILGGRVSATSKQSYGIISTDTNGTITLGWTRPANSICATNTDGTENAYGCTTLKVKDGQTLWNGTEALSGTITDMTKVDGKTLVGVDVLQNAAANDIAALNGKTTNAVLYGRTLYKDGSWNTLCLPFDVTTTSGTLSGDGVQAMTLNTTTSRLGDDGTLTLNFDATGTTITAGTPFIIKWTSGSSISNPVFEGVTVSTATNNATIPGTLTFTGTYAPKIIGDGGDNTVLYLGAANTLYYPTKAMTIGCQRAYFQLLDGLTAGKPSTPSSPNNVRAFVLNFGDEATGIIEVKADADLKSASRESGISNPLQHAWHTLDGRRLSQKPTTSGIYINGGRKVVVK